MTASPDFFAESAKNPTSAENAHVGLPSEEEIARAIRDWQMRPGFDGWDAKVAALATDILSLIRPAFEAKDAEIRKLALLLDKQMGTPCEQIRHQQEVEELRAKLAQAVEAMEPFDDALGEDDEGYGGGLTVVMKWGACTDYSVTLEDLRDLRKACRTASAAARGET